MYIYMCIWKINIYLVIVFSSNSSNNMEKFTWFYILLKDWAPDKKL